MSTNTAYLFDLWLVHLRQACYDAGQPATAGQVAKVAGTSRTTAQKWLRSMMILGLAETVEGTHVNGQPKTGYQVTAAFEW